jgi:hypothetical protein
LPFISEVAPIFVQRFYSGLITLRNQLATPIRLMGRRVIELYDALIAGNDWEVTPSLSLKRRAGHTLLVVINYAAMRLYSWKSNTQGTIPIFDTLQDIEFYQSGAVTSFATKGASTGKNLQSSILGIGNYLYVGNPQTNFKWDGPSGPQGKTNWGIVGGATVTTDAAGTGTNIQPPGTVTAWTNPNNVTSASAYATIALPSQFPASQILEAYNFGFALTGTLTGITVTFDASMSGTNPHSFDLLGVFPMYNGVQTGSFTQAFTPTNAVENITCIINLNLSPLTVAQINNSTSAGFGIGFQVAQSTNTFSIRNVKVAVTTNPIPVATPTGAGSFAAVNGFSYVLAYGNATSGEISNASSASVNTEPFSSKAYVGVAVVASADPQVNQIRVYRTTDSGGGNQFFEIANSPFSNVTTTIQDVTLDVNLQVTSRAEINLGNTPPPAGLINLEWFAGRMWGSVGNILYASTGPETISGTAPNSNWNPLFQWVIPGPIIRNIRGPNGMIVFTNDDSYIVRGTDITNYTVNEFVKDFGIRSYNALDTDGTNMYVFTSDRQFICVSSSGANDIGLPIGDQLLNVDPSKVYVSVNRYGLDSIVRILDTVANVYYDQNLNQQCWNLPGILKMPSCAAMGSIEVSPGVWRLLISSTSGGTSSLAYRDISNFQDLGTSYAPNAVFGTIQLADPGTLAKFGGCGGFNLQWTLAGTLPSLSVLPNDIGATLTNPVGSQITGSFVNLSTPKNGFPWPPTLGNQPIAYRSVGYYWMAAKALSAYVLHLQFQISAPAENTATELLGFGIFGDYKQEIESAGQLPQLQGR